MITVDPSSLLGLWRSRLGELHPKVRLSELIPWLLGCQNGNRVFPSLVASHQTWLRGLVSSLDCFSSNLACITASRGELRALITSPLNVFQSSSVAESKA